MKKVLLSLFDHSGTWSAPYKEAGWHVIQVDLKHGIDIMDITYDWLLERMPEGCLGVQIDGIIAAPPCTDFSVSGAQYWKAKDADGRTKKALKLVCKTLELVGDYNPEFWALENPVGRLPKLLPIIGKPKYFQPYFYGDAYTKKTGLWGEFTFPEPTDMVEPERVCAQGSWLMKLGGKSERTKELRSVTPPGFSRAFFESNN